MKKRQRQNRQQQQPQLVDLCDEALEMILKGVLSRLPPEHAAMMRPQSKMARDTVDAQTTELTLFGKRLGDPYDLYRYYIEPERMLEDIVRLLHRVGTTGTTGAPLTSLKFSKSFSLPLGSILEDAADSLRSVTSLSFEHDLNNEDIEALIKSPVFGGLVELSIIVPRRNLGFNLSVLVEAIKEGGCPLLKRMTFRKIQNEYESMTGFLSALVDGCPLLEEIDVDFGCSRLLYQDIGRFVVDAPNLHTLRWERCSAVDMEDALSGTTLRTLDFSGSQFGTHFFDFARALRNSSSRSLEGLRVLRLDRTEMTDAHALAIAESLVAGGGRNLRVLSIAFNRIKRASTLKTLKAAMPPGAKLISNNNPDSWADANICPRDAMRRPVQKAIDAEHAASAAAMTARSVKREDWASRAKAAAAAAWAAAAAASAAAAAAAAATEEGAEAAAAVAVSVAATKATAAKAAAAAATAVAKLPLSVLAVMDSLLVQEWVAEEKARDVAEAAEAEAEAARVGSAAGPTGSAAVAAATSAAAASAAATVAAEAAARAAASAVEWVAELAAAVAKEKKTAKAAAKASAEAAKDADAEVAERKAEDMAASVAAARERRNAASRARYQKKKSVK